MNEEKLKEQIRREIQYRVDNYLDKEELREVYQKFRKNFTKEQFLFSYKKEEEKFEKISSIIKNLDLNKTAVQLSFILYICAMILAGAKEIKQHNVYILFILLFVVVVLNLILSKYKKKLEKVKGNLIISEIIKQEWEREDEENI